jgi:CheY-like chemotaxis protein
MSYKALLFCPDEKTARVVTQVLSELEFQVEPCNQPFAAVKKLMAEHFDAIVVDCDNEQNAALLFKSAHNSGSNQASLSVAVVEGQSGVAKAFRIGANLVLTKPINVEQSKGTLRVARGLLRKSEASKTAAANASRPSAGMTQTTRPPAPNFVAPKPAISSLPVPPPPSKISAVSASLLDVEEEPTVKPEPTEAALLESMSDPSQDRSIAPDSSSTPAATKEYPWQPVSKPMAGPMATALRRAAEAAGKPVVDPPATKSEPTPTSITESAMGRSFSSTAGPISTGHGTAAAPARSAPRHEEEVAKPEVEVPSFGAIGEASPASGGSKKTILIVVAVLVAAAAIGYVGWTKMHSTTSTPTAQPVAAPSQTAPTPTEPPPPSSLPMSQAKPTAAEPSQPAASLTAHASAPALDAPLASSDRPAPATKKES